VASYSGPTICDIRVICGPIHLRNPAAVWRHIAVCLGLSRPICVIPHPLHLRMTWLPQPARPRTLWLIEGRSTLRPVGTPIALRCIGRQVRSVILPLIALLALSSFACSAKRVGGGSALNIMEQSRSSSPSPRAMVEQRQPGREAGPAGRNNRGSASPRAAQAPRQQTVAVTTARTTSTSPPPPQLEATADGGVRRDSDESGAVRAQEPANVEGGATVWSVTTDQLSAPWWSRLPAKLAFIALIVGLAVLLSKRLLRHSRLPS
jgi:hypothetical protein